MSIESISALTLATGDMKRAVEFYKQLGFELIYGGSQASFTSFRAGSGFLNLTSEPTDGPARFWGRAIFYVDNVDRLYEQAVSAGFSPSTRPRDAEWQERYFHVTDPDGHELSFARPLR
ncbi:MAG: glyoxalase [Thiotrichales bacterium]|nr:glyoxalase [Thiotrichales bacterium]|tara:strand:- start:118 stop:474 length:357 start_codon:yes stop_codon:yes gene_type:complete